MVEALGDRQDVSDILTKALKNVWLRRWDACSPVYRIVSVGHTPKIEFYSPVFPGQLQETLDEIYAVLTYVKASNREVRFVKKGGNLKRLVSNKFFDRK